MVQRDKIKKNMTKLNLLIIINNISKRLLLLIILITN